MFFVRLPPPPTSPLFPTRRSSDLSELHRFFRQQPGGEQHARVARVGARGDGGDQHIAVLDLDAVVRPVGPAQVFGLLAEAVDRKSTRLNSSHTVISYAVFCLKKKKGNICLYHKKNKKTNK